MKELNQALKSTPVIYVTRDIERALGLPLETPGYFIMTNNTPFAKNIAQTHDNVYIIESDTQLDTWQLLKTEQAKGLIDQKPNARILVFKNTKQIETICQENNWTLLNPAAAISNQVEPKISQITWLEELAEYLPQYTVTTCEQIIWDGNPFVLQFNRSHTGSGTKHITSKKDLESIQQTFPKREARIANYIHGPLYTNNNCVQENDILISNISYQITGLPPFTDRQFATIGNDWGLPKHIITDEQKRQYITIAKKVGEKLRKAGWKGLFGIDTIVNQETGQLHLLEINCRQPASTTYESQLQQQKDSNGFTIFQAHLMALLELTPPSTPFTILDDGAQIIYRVKDTQTKTPNKQILEEHKYHTISYNNTKPGTDLLRIQSLQSFMDNHDTFNKNGQTLVSLIS